MVYQIPLHRMILVFTSVKAAEGIPPGPVVLLPSVILRITDGGGGEEMGGEYRPFRVESGPLGRSGWEGSYALLPLPKSGGFSSLRYVGLSGRK